MYKFLRNARMPGWLRWLLYIVLTLTCVYLIGMLTYKILENFRKVINWLTEKNTYWVFFIVSFLAVVIVLLLAQFCWDLDPVGKSLNWFNDKWNYLISYIERK